MFLKNVIMTATLELVDEDINATHNSINLKPVDVLPDLCINLDFEI